MAGMAAKCTSAPMKSIRNKNVRGADPKNSKKTVRGFMFTTSTSRFEELVDLSPL